MDAPFLIVETPRAGDSNHRFIAPERRNLDDVMLQDYADRAKAAFDGQDKAMGLDFIAIRYPVTQAKPPHRKADEMLILAGLNRAHISVDQVSDLIKRLRNRINDLDRLMTTEVVWSEASIRGTLYVRRPELDDWSQEFTSLPFLSHRTNSENSKQDLENTLKASKRFPLRSIVIAILLGTFLITACCKFQATSPAGPRGQNRPSRPVDNLPLTGPAVGLPETPVVIDPKRPIPRNNPPSPQPRRDLQELAETWRYGSVEDLERDLWAALFKKDELFNPTELYRRDKVQYLSGPQGEIEPFLLLGNAEFPYLKQFDRSTVGTVAQKRAYLHKLYACLRSLAGAVSKAQISGGQKGYLAMAAKARVSESNKNCAAVKLGVYTEIDSVMATDVMKWLESEEARDFLRLDKNKLKFSRASFEPCIKKLTTLEENESDDKRMAILVEMKNCFNALMDFPK